MYSTPTACPICGKASVFGSPYCADHPRAREKQFDREKREPWHGWYGLAVWKRLRQLRLHRNPYCQWPGCRPYPATAVDHIIPHRGDWALFLKLENTQSLCAHHHSQKTGKGE